MHKLIFTNTYYWPEYNLHASWLTGVIRMEPAKQVVAGLLQQHIVVSFISAVWVIFITQVT